VQAVTPGGSTLLNGACFARNADISLVLTSDPVNLGTARTDASGNFSFTVTIPTNTPPGNHTLTASGAGQSATLTILVSQPLSTTGMRWNLAILGLAMVAAGIILMAGDRIGKQDLIDFA
jgi:hypothetical protein